MANKKEEVISFFIETTIQGVVNGLVLVAVLKIFKLI